MATDWQHFREIFTVLGGAIVLVIGIIRSDAAMMTIGGGLIGFSPASKGPE